MWYKKHLKKILNMKKIAVSILTLSLFIISCSKSKDEPVVEEKITKEEVEPVVEEPAIEITDYPIQDFIWKAMNAYYFWQSDVNDLADNRFSSETEYAEYLSKNTDPEKFFYEKLLSTEDRFSFIDDDYKDLVAGLTGNSKSNGSEFGISTFSNSNDVFGYIRYIVPNSDAATKDIKRGDIFTGVNGQTLNLDNYLDLLFGDADSYTLNMADIANNTITPNNKSVTLTKEENLEENPILIKKVIEQNGLKIGYLLYNSFIADYDEELNDAFGEFKTAAIDELILDFRYNGGGRVTSALQIASSVYGTNTDELFLKARYNDKLQNIFDSADLESNFIDTTIEGSVINTLNLNNVYVITSTDTASASELVINGLAPYVNVVQIGARTIGKNEFSNTLVDDLENGYIYSPERESEINPDNQWALQPLLGRNENADGFSDYTAGLIPDHELFEDFGNLGVLGETDEPLLALALSKITGTTAKTDFTPLYPVNLISSSSQFKPTHNLMLMDGLLKPMVSK